MPSAINSTNSQLIDIAAQSAKTDQQIGFAILKKQQDVQKTTAKAVLQLLESAVPTPNERQPRLDIQS